MNTGLFIVSDILSKIQSEVSNGQLVNEDFLKSHLWEQAPQGLEYTSFQYLPRITQADINDPKLVQSRIDQTEGFALDLVERDGDNFKPASNRSEYFPLLIQASNYDSDFKLGLDNFAEPLHQIAMMQARDTGVLSSTVSFPMRDFKGDLVTHYYIPLYEGTGILDSVEERRSRHIGFISAVNVYPSEAIVDFLPEPYQGIDVAFYSSVENQPFSNATNKLEVPPMQDGIIQESYLINNVPFQLATKASDNLKVSMISNNRWWGLSIGLLLTAWMSTIVVWSSKQSQKIIKVVDERTRDLATKTKKLSELNVALGESEARYRMLANNVSDVIYTHDMDGVCTYISPSIQMQNGYGVEDYLGKKIYCHMTEECASIAKLRIAQTVKTYREQHTITHDNRPFEFETNCKDGSIKSLEASISSIYNDYGDLVGFMGVMRDISPRKKAEKEKELLQTAYRQAQKMEAIGTLAGGIAHDFNNLLTGVIGHADLLKLEFESHPEAIKSLNIIEMAAMRAKDLTSQLLGFARKGQFQSSPVEINQVIAEVLSLIERTVDKNIAITLKDCRLNPVVIGDPAQISQIFLNLAVNAKDAMPNGGNLIFEVTLEDLDSDFCLRHFDTHPGKYCVISVSDTGIGIPADKLEHIFEPFFTDKSDGKGTGLGLAMVYGVTKNHKGAVTVYSEVGSGSVFKVYLPACESQKQISKKPKVQSLRKGSGTILLVDDQDVVLQVGKKMLSQLGYSVLLAEDGKIGVDIYQDKQHTIDLVIIDMIMPNLGGLDCLEALREINPEVKAILSSGFSKDSIADKINEEHIMGFLQKPFRLQELSELVASIHH